MAERGRKGSGDSDWVSPVWKIRKTLQDFRDLLRENRSIALVIIGVVVAYILYDVYGNIRRRDIEDSNKTIGALKDENNTLRQKLAPFEALAAQRFPDQAEDKRIDLLLKKMDDLLRKFDESTSASAPRRLSDSAVKILTSSLPEFSSYSLSLSYVPGDKEARALATQIRAVFQASRWGIEEGVDLRFDPLKAPFLVLIPSGIPKKLGDALARSFSEFKPIFGNDKGVQPPLSPKQILIFIGHK